MACSTFPPHTYSHSRGQNYGAVGPRIPSLNNPAKHAQREPGQNHRWCERDCTGRMVALNVRCYVAVAVHADRLVDSRLWGSERAFLYLSSLIPRVGGREWVRQNGQTALVERQGEGAGERAVSLGAPGPSKHTIPSRWSQPLARTLIGKGSLRGSWEVFRWWQMELLLPDPRVEPRAQRRRRGCFLFPCPLGAQGQIETGSLQGRC